jgi:flagellin
MSLRINTNSQALAAQRSLSINHHLQNNSLEHLASGSRINRAGDDAAGLAISEKMKSHIRSMKQSSRNANDGISLIQVAEGGLTEMGNILTRMRELSIQGASDTIGDTERRFIDREIQQIKSEFDRIAGSTEFNGTKLLDGSSPALDIQVGIHNDNFLDRFNFDTEKLHTTTDRMGISNVSTATKQSSQENLSMIDSALTRVSENRAELGALQNRLQSTINNLAIYRENLEAANSRIRDTDMAEETTELTRTNILTNANISVLAQANQTPQQALKLLS